MGGLNGAPAADVTEYAERLLATTRDELRFADAKAAIVFTVISLATAVAVTSDTRPRGLYPILSWFAAGSLIASCLLSAAAVYPRVNRTTRSRPPHVAYFGDIARFSTRAELEAALRGSADVKHEVICQELLEVSRIALTKHRLIACSLWFMLGAVIVLSLALALS